MKHRTPVEEEESSSSNTKDEILDEIDRHYLERVSSAVNNSVRSDYHSYTNAKFKDYIKGKYTKSDLIAIWQEYMLCNPPESPAERIRERSAGELVSEYKSTDKSKDYFIEYRVAGDSCDLIEVEGENNILTAIEVKSNGDDLRRAKHQCERYSEWANMVYLLTEAEKAPEALEHLPSWIGVITAEKDNVQVLREAEKHHHSISELTKLMTVDQLREILETINEDIGGSKEELRDYVDDSLDSIELKNARKVLIGAKGT